MMPHNIEHRISVIVPTYNNAEYISDAIESALNQTYPILEVIVINDGSTDNTREVIKLFCDKVVYVEQSNLGPAAARNAGINIAHGDFIAFLDADDLWMPDKLEKQLSVFEKNPETALVYAQMINFDDDISSVKLPFPRITYSGKLFDKILTENFIPLPSVIVKTKIVKAVNGFDERLITAEDTNLWLKISRDYEIIGIDEPLIMRRKHEANLSDRSDIPVGTLDNLDMIVEAYPEISPKLYDPMRKAYINRGRSMMIDYFHNGNYSQCHSTGTRVIKHGMYDSMILIYWLITLFPRPIIDWIRKANKYNKYI